MSEQLADLPEPTLTDPLDIDGHAIDCQIDHRVTLANTHLHRAGEHGTYRGIDSSGGVAVSHSRDLSRQYISLEVHLTVRLMYPIAVRIIKLKGGLGMGRSASTIPIAN